MRREERVTVQGPVKEQQPDGLLHGGSSRCEMGWGVWGSRQRCSDTTRLGPPGVQHFPVVLNASAVGRLCSSARRQRVRVPLPNGAYALVRPPPPPPSSL